MGGMKTWAVPETSLRSSQVSPDGVPRRSGIPLRWSAVVVVLSAAYYAFVATGAQPALWRTAGLAFTVQILCFAFAATLLGFRRGWVLPRISDPGVLFLLWASAYLVYPTGVWLRGGLVLDATVAGYVRVVLQAHSVFLLVFMTAFLLAGGRRFWGPPDTDTRYLPTGRPLVLIPLVFLVGIAAVRIASSGTLLPGSNYADAWFNLESQITSARVSGGLDYIAAQILGKGYFYAVLALGIGCGLAFARAIQFRRGRLRLLLGVIALIILSLLMGITTRSGALMVLVIAILLADLLTGLVRWRYTLLAFGLGFMVFVFFGYFRSSSSLGLARGATFSYQQFSRPDGHNNIAAAEFVLMLQKEVVGARMFDRQAEGPQLVVRDALGLIPSQLLPGKLEWAPTASLLSFAMLGGVASQGGGVAGSAIADGFRIGGLAGVGLSAALLGVLLGAVYRWLNAPRLPGGRPQLLRVALAAGYFAWCFAFIRGDFALMLSTTFYVVVVPWEVLRFTLSGWTRRTWLGPLPHGRASARPRSRLAAQEVAG
jgi:hypothetical protein